MALQKTKITAFLMTVLKSSIAKSVLINQSGSFRHVWNIDLLLQTLWMICCKKRPLKILHLQASGRDGKERPGKVQGKKGRVGSGAAGTDETGTGDKSCYSIFMFNLKINR